MIQNEVAILRRVKHPNIVLLIEEFDTYNELYLVMELVKVCGNVCLLLLYAFVHHLLSLLASTGILPNVDNEWLHSLIYNGDHHYLKSKSGLEGQGGRNSDGGAAFTL